MDNPRPATITPSEVIEWRNAGTLNITPKFQRRGVWKVPQRSYFMDTLMRSMPCPPVYLRDAFDVRKTKMMHEVIDGQQRLRAVLDFIDGHYALSRKIKSEFVGKKFSELPKEERVAIMSYTFHSETFQNISDQEVFDVFRRMNTYSSPLTKQELRHGRFFGKFSQTCESLALEYLDFWRSYKILSEPKISRMAEVQLTSALLVTQIHGLQDLSNSLDDFYEKYDERFPGRTTHQRNFRHTMDILIDLFRDTLPNLQFRKPPFFYSLFGAVLHRTIGMPNVKLSTPKRKLTARDQDGIQRAVDVLSNVISIARAQQRLGGAADASPPKLRRYPAKFHEFAQACLSQTDNINPRRIRLETIYREAFG